MDRPDDIQFLGTVGEGVVQEYIEGVPARNLTRGEWEALRSDQRERALATALYFDPLEMQPGAGLAARGAHEGIELQEDGSTALGEGAN